MWQVIFNDNGAFWACASSLLHLCVRGAYERELNESVGDVYVYEEWWFMAFIHGTQHIRNVPLCVWKKWMEWHIGFSIHTHWWQCNTVHTCTHTSMYRVAQNPLAVIWLLIAKWMEMMENNAALKLLSELRPKSFFCLRRRYRRPKH